MSAADAYEAAAMVALAAMLGMDWEETDAELETHGSGADELDMLDGVFDNDFDACIETLRIVVMRHKKQRKSYRLRADACHAINQFAQDLRLQVVK